MNNPPDSHSVMIDSARCIAAYATVPTKLISATTIADVEERLLRRRTRP